MYAIRRRCAVFVILLSIHVSHSSLIPETFRNQDNRSYEIRYLSNNGVDSSACLVNQSYPADSSAQNTTACASMGYAIFGSNQTTGSRENIIVLVYPGHYDFGIAGIELKNSQNVIVSRIPGDYNGDVALFCGRYRDDGFNNFYVFQSIDIAFVGMYFERCGPYSTPLVVSQSTALFISNCTFRNNLISGLALYHCDEFWIGNTTFCDNNASSVYITVDSLSTFNPGNVRLAGGLTIVWGYDNINATGFTGTVTDCHFHRNSAGISDLNSGNERPSLYLPRGKGGAIGLTFFKAVGCRLIIRNCDISYNYASFYGGAIYIGLTSKSLQNNVIISDSTFKSNTAKNGTGGAISMNSFEGSNNNILAVLNSSFEANTAFVRGGGACSIAIQDNIISDGLVLLNNVAWFSGSNFTNNTAHTGGSAIQLISNARVDQFSASVNFTDCWFIGNNASTGGSILSIRIPITLDGSTVFQENSGGAISLFRSRIDVRGNATFERNFAEQGAAILMQDLSLIQLLSGSNLAFIANNATSFGGAVASVGVSSDSFVFFNTRCFLQYEVTTVSLFSVAPENWITTVKFINNTAGQEGAALYVSNLELCTYTRRSYSSRGTDFQNFSTAYENSIFQVNETFQFSGNKVLNPVQESYVSVDQLATAPVRLEVTISNDPSIKEIEAAPNSAVLLYISAYDQANNSQPAVWTLEDLMGDNAAQATVAYFDVPRGGVRHRYTVAGLTVAESVSINCTLGIKRIVNFTLIDINGGGVVSETQVVVRVKCCYPGYQFEFIPATGLYTCEHQHLGGIILRPNFNKTSIYVRSQIYIGQEDGTLVYAVMPPPFQECTQERAQSGCFVDFDNLDGQCTSDREGFMCGKCKGDKGVDLTLQKCRDCHAWDAVIVAVIVTLFVVVSVLVLLFNIGVPNDLRGCLFFVQVVGFVYSYSAGNTVTWDFHISRIFGFNLYLPLCPSPGYDALSTALYGFILSFFAMATVIGYIICARFIRALSRRSSFDGIWLLSIITYKYTADTCFSILRCVKVSGVSNEFRYYYDGSIVCFQFGGKHVAPAVFSIILVVFVVILYPIGIFVISYRRFKRTYVFTDVLTDGIKVPCRWWSGFDLYRRLLFITVVFVFNYINPDYIQIALLFASLVVFVIFARSKPYTSTRSNIIEALVLLDLIVITALFLNRHENIQSGQYFRVAAIILLLLPFITVFLYILCKVCILASNKLLPAGMKTTCMERISGLKPGKKTSKEKSTISNLTEHTELEDEFIRQTGYSRFREELLASNEVSQT